MTERDCPIILILSEHPKALIMKRHVTLLYICHIRNVCSEFIVPVMGTWAHNASYQTLTFRRIKQPLVREQSTAFTGVHVFVCFFACRPFSIQTHILAQTGSDVSPCHLGDGDGC